MVNGIQTLDSLTMLPFDEIGLYVKSLPMNMLIAFCQINDIEFQRGLERRELAEHALNYIEDLITNGEAV